ncbi:hypothetical protein Tco_0268729 [Tanacetum coccineum]
MALSNDEIVHLWKANTSNADISKAPMFSMGKVRNQEEPTLEDSPITHDALHPLFNPVTGEPGSTQSSSRNVNSAEPTKFTQPPEHTQKMDRKITLFDNTWAIHIVLKVEWGGSSMAVLGVIEKLNTMAEQNVPAQAPARTDEQIVPRSQWLQIGKSNLLFDAQKIQKNPIFQISVDILRNTNFFRAFSASASVPAVYIQQTIMKSYYTREPHSSHTKQVIKHSERPKKKAVPLLIPYGRFTKMIIYYLGSTSDVHKRPESPCHLPGDDFLLGEGDDPALELDKKMSLDAHQEKGEGEGADADIERAIKLSLDPSFLPKGQAPVGGVVIKDPVSETTPKLLEVVGKDDTSEKVVQESSSTTDSERTESETEAAAPKGDKEQGEVASSTVTSGVGISVRTEDQAGSDPGKAHEALAGPDPEPMQEDQTGPDSGKVHVSLAGPNPEHMDEEFLATAYPKVHENLKLITDECVIEDNPESHSGSMSSMKNLEDTDNFGDQFLYDKPTEDDQEKSKVVDESDSTIPDPSHQTVTTLPITTEATSITTTLPEITPFIALQLRVARLEQEMSEVKKTDHSAAVLASIKSQVPTVVDQYLGTKLDDALLRIPWIRRLKTELKTIKRKHDSDDDEDNDDDEGPLAGSNQGKSAKRRRHDSGASGSAQPPHKDDEQSLKKPHDSDASASKQHPTLTSPGWQITDTRDVVINSSRHSSEPEFGHYEHSSDDVSKQDEGHISDLEDTDNAHIPKVKAATWFKPIQEDERPATPEPEWTIPPNDFPEPENNWANAYATSYQVPAENKLQRKTYDIGSFIKWFCRRTGKKKLCKADLEGPAFNLVDLVNPEGHQILRNIYEPLPLGGPPGQVTIQPQFFFNKDLEYLLTGDKERKTALSISKLKAARYLDFGLEELVPSLWVESERDYDISAAYGITHWWFRRKEFYINKHSEPSDREAVRSQMRILSVIRVKTFEKYGYNYLREIILRRADYKEYKISEKDFKNLHPNDFEDLYLLYSRQNSTHLSKFRTRSIYTPVVQHGGFRNLFCDGTLTEVMEKLDYTVKIFICSSTIRDGARGNGQRMTKGGAKTSSQRSRKDYRSGGSFEVWKALLEEEYEILTTG